MENERKKDVLIVVLDGCRADALKKAEVPNIVKLASEGIYAENAITVYPSLTAVGHASIITGAYPERHGIINHFYWDKRGGKLVNLFSDEYVEVPTLFDALQQSGMSGVSIGAQMRKGSKDPLTRKMVRKVADYIASTQLMNVLSKRPSLYRFFRTYAMGRFIEFKKAYECGEHALYYLCFYEVDKAGHRYGPESDKYYETIEECDKKLGEILGLREELNRDTMIIITSDHGQNTLKKKIPLETLYFDEFGYRLDECKEIAGSAIITYNEDKEDMAVAIVVSRHVQLWLYNLDDVLKIRKALSSKGDFTFVKSKNETSSINLYHERLGDLSFCLKEGCGFDFLPFAESGDHGGIDNADMNVPLIVWRKESNLKTLSKRIVDIAPLVLATL